MAGTADRVLRICALALLLLSAKANLAAADRVSEQVPFQYAQDRDSILLRVQINDKPAVLILDTGSAHTVLRPEVVGVDRKELTPIQAASSGGFLGDAVGLEVTLQVGSLKWEKRKVAVMDLTQVLSVYQEKIDGVLGLDFLKEFSQVTINIKDQTIIFVGEARTASSHDLVPAQSVATGKLSFGNLRKFTLEGGSGQYVLNGVTLPKVSTASILLGTPDQTYQVQVRFYKTVVISKSRPSDRGNEALLQRWVKDIPLVSQILTAHDSIGSLKPVAYSLIEPKGRTDLQLQEELVYLWSSDPDDSGKIGNTSLLPSLDFSSPLTDVQYRGIKSPAGKLFGKIILQILYIKDHFQPVMLGGFVIVSKPDGEYEFYLVPRSVLDRIVIETPKAEGQ